MLGKMRWLQSSNPQESTTGADTILISYKFFKILKLSLLFSLFN